MLIYAEVHCLELKSMDFARQTRWKTSQLDMGAILNILQGKIHRPNNLQVGFLKDTAQEETIRHRIIS
jgi:hypothetical protein